MSMLERFLRYSLRHQRPIRVMLMDEAGQTRHQNITVQNLDEEGISYLSARNKKQPRHLPYQALLAASYARGDDGDTFPRAEKETKD